MDPSLHPHIGRTCSVLKTQLKSDVFRSIRQLGIGRRIPTKRGTRTGLLFRLWYNLPPASRTKEIHQVHTNVVGGFHFLFTFPHVNEVKVQGHL